MLLDGNCLFRSVAHQPLGDAEQHDKLRQATVTYMYMYAAQQGEVLKGDASVSLQQYLEKMSNLGYWGTDFELRTMASEYAKPAHIYFNGLTSFW